MYPPQVPGFPSQPSAYPPQSNPGYPPQTHQTHYSPSSTDSCYLGGQNPYPSHQATPYNNQNYPTIPNSTMPQHGGYSSSSGCVPISMTQSYSDGPAIKKSKVCI